MRFTNIGPSGIYLSCCHREVEPGGTFEVPWFSIKDDRAVHEAMASGNLHWESGENEPVIPGNPPLPKVSRQKAAKEAREKAKAEADRAIVAQKRIDDAAVSENMARMGNFKVPQPMHRDGATRKSVAEAPITKKDLISGESPRSLADIRRHNRAVKQLPRADASPNPSGKR